MQTEQTSTPYRNRNTRILSNDIDPLEECSIEEHDIHGGAFCRRPKFSADEDAQDSEMFWVTL